MRTQSLYLAVFVGFLALTSNAHAIDLYFENQIHDPSTIQNDNGVYWVHGTGDGITTRYSDDLISWQIGDPVFPIGTWPSWINTYVANFAGNFWAPDIIFMNGAYYVYYSCFATINGGTGFQSAIGVVSTPSLTNPVWTDHGMVVSSTTEPLSPQGQPINTIDAGLFTDAGGNVWMVYGSHYGGIYMVQIDPSTGKRMNALRFPVAGNNGAWNDYEGAQVTYINGFYYMFANLGECCAGNTSTYYIVTGRSLTPTGPYLDQGSIDLWDGGGTTVLATDGDYIGPGHYGYYNNAGQNLVSIHYYDGSTTDGWPSKLDLLEMTFSGGWPVLSRNFTIQGVTPPALVDANLVDGGTFNIVAKHSGKLLEARGRGGSCGNLRDGTNVEQGTADGSQCQKWTVQRMRDKNGNVTEYSKHYWTIHPSSTPGQAMDLTSFSQLDGANIQTWTFLNHEAQQFRLVDQGNGFYEIVIRASGKVLNVANSSSVDGANVEQWGSAGLDSQQYSFMDVAGGDTTPPAAPTGLVASPADSSVHLDWADNSEPDLDSYSVYRSTTSGGGYTSLASGLTSSDYTDNTAVNGTTYYYVVTATDTSSNESTDSSEASATPQSGGDPTVLFVSNIVLTTVNAGKGSKRGQAQVTILDDTGSPVGNANVTGTFSGGFNEAVSATTDGNGLAVFTTTGTKKGGVTFTFCVDNVTGTLPYDSNQNIETCDSF